jgi:hypothetical protein
MSKQMLLTIAIIAVSAGVFTLISYTGIDKKSAGYNDTCGANFKSVSRGLPLRYETVVGSVSTCEPVEDFWAPVHSNTQNVFHAWNFLIDLVFWAGIATPIVIFLNWITRTRHG